MRTAFEDGRGAIVFHPTPDPAVTIVVTGMGSAPHLLGCLRSVAHSDPSVPFEVIVSLNRPSPQLIDALGNEVEGVTVLTSRVNRGFGGACNQAASLARGECILFLNDDTVVDHYWLRELVDMLRDRPGVGAVGSRMLHLDGSLQESGSFLWSDGSTNSAAGERDNPAGDYRWARAVDYCSAASLMVRRSVWERLGGFDDDYYPAYYEDVDLCLRIWALGIEVWCQPTSVVWHHRSTSSARGFRDFLMARGRRILREKHAATLAAQPDRTGDPVLDEEAGQRHRSGGAIRLLVVDDRVPDGALGSGYRRMADELAELAASGSFRIDFHATDEKVDDAGELARRGIRLLDGELDDHLRRPHVHYGAVVLSRPHNFERHGSAVRRWQPDAALIYDAEAMYFRRTDRHAALAETTGERTRLRHEAASMRSSEEALVRRADRVISICEEEAALARAVTGAPPVHVIEARLHGIEPTRRRYRDRRDIVLVAGWLAGPDSPNADGLLWFLRRASSRSSGPGSRGSGCASPASARRTTSSSTPPRTCASRAGSPTSTTSTTGPGWPSPPSGSAPA